MGDDAEYQIEQEELEKRENEANRQARLEEDARRNREWGKVNRGQVDGTPKPE